MAPYNRLSATGAPRNATGAGFGPTGRLRPFLWLLRPWTSDLEGCRVGDKTDDVARLLETVAIYGQSGVWSFGSVDLRSPVR